MPPALAAVVFIVGIASLFLLDRSKARGSKVLWLPIVWLFFCSSRSFTQWLGMDTATTAAERAMSALEGSPLDRGLYIVLELAALIVVISRRRRVGPLLRRNWPIGLFFFYAALSMAWSDFPLVTLKHWSKGLGDILMVLIVLTEPGSVADTIKRLVTRLGFVLVPLSLLFIRYYPSVGRTFSLGGDLEPIGVTTQKNMLGELCSVVGLGLLWCFRNTYNDRKDPNRRQRLIAFGVVLAIIVWLLWMCDSMTSIGALSMASLVMFLSKRPTFRRRHAYVHLLIAGALTCTMYALFFQSSSGLIQSLGRDPSLTGRTDIWTRVLAVPSNRLIGVGYESFWVGPRLQFVWDAFPGLLLNEAHSGYVEILLTLGWVGEVLLGIVIGVGYRNVISAYRRDPAIGSFRIAWFLATLITAFTEAAFRVMGLPWIVLLLAATAWTGVARKDNSRVSLSDQLSAPDQVRDLAGEAISVR